MIFHRKCSKKCFLTKKNHEIVDEIKKLKIDSAQKLEKIKKNPKNMLVLSTIRSVS